MTVAKRENPYVCYYKSLAVFIVAHPLCEVCQREGRVTTAEEVHHIILLTQGGTHEDGNLMSLCKECHSRITVREGVRRC